MTASLDVDIDTLIAESNDVLKIDDSQQPSIVDEVNDNNNNDLNGETSPPPTTTQNASSAGNTIEIDAKQKKKLDKFIDNLFKRNNLNDLKSFEDKFYALANKYNDQLDQNKQKDNQIKDLQKHIVSITKARDSYQQENSKSLLARNKLESLCRELQRHNKAIKEENLNRTKEEEEKRKEISNKFQAAIDEINQQVNSNTERNNSLIQENVLLASRLKSMLDQYDQRELHMEKVLKHKDLENQLLVAKFQQAELRIAELNERNKQCEELIGELTKKCEYYAKAEDQLKGQLKVYTEKYEEFQNTLNKSNEVFSSFRTEMDKMTKKIKKLEQETNQWKTRYDTCNTKLSQITEQKDAVEKETKKQQTRADKLEQLSRTLQTERSNLIQQLKQYEKPIEAQKVELPPPQTPTVTETPAATNDEVVLSA